MHSYHQMAQYVKHWAFKAGGCYDNQLQLPASWLKLDCFWGRRRTRGQRKKGKKRRGWGRVRARGEESNLWRPAVNVRTARQSELGSACAHQDHGAHHLIPLSPLGSLALLNGVVWLFDMKATFFPAARGELALRGHHLSLFVSPPVLGVIPPPRYFTRANFLLKRLHSEWVSSAQQGCELSVRTAPQNVPSKWPNDSNFISNFLVFGRHFLVFFRNDCKVTSFSNILPHVLKRGCFCLHFFFSTYTILNSLGQIVISPQPQQKNSIDLPKMA